jgi:hypothetical protein
MPFAMIKLKPGVNSELTPSLNEAGYQSSNLGRYRNGLFEKIGGWEAYYPFAVGGVPKALHAWLDLNEQKYLGCGSTTILGSINSGTLTNITPQDKTTNFNEDFDTTNGSPNVTVDDPGIANVTSYDSVEFLTPVAVGGLILAGVYPIALSLGTTTYRIVAAANATSTVASGGAVPSFTTTSASQIVTVTLVAHGLSVGSKFNLPISTTVGGLALVGTYTVLTVPTADTFTIGANSLATSGATVSMNSGQARIVYHIALGPASTGSGYGIGTYGSGGYGTGTSSSAQTGTNISATDWALDNWGEILIANPEGGGIYEWQPQSGFQNAKMISGNSAPAYNNGCFVSMQTQMLICYGSSTDLSANTPAGIGIDQDPLLVKWSNQGDYTDFTISTTSQAGSRRLSTGSKIVGGMSVSQQELLWTDLDLWAMSYLGGLQAGVWGFTTIGKSCGLIGKHAAARLGSNVFWMGRSNFFVMAGSGVQVIPCDIWDTVFQDLSTTYQHKCVALANTPYNEIWYMVVRESTGATEPDLLVKYNILLGTWEYSELDRSAGIDQSILGQPIYASSQGVIYEHEVTNDAAGQAINSYFTTGDAQLTQGQDIIFIDWLLPDFIWHKSGASGSAAIQLTLYSKYYPGDTPQVHGPYTVTQSTKYINPRIRGRLVSMKVESNDVGSFWRLGGVRYRGAQDGRL